MKIVSLEHETVELIRQEKRRAVFKFICPNCGHEIITLPVRNFRKMYKGVKDGSIKIGCELKQGQPISKLRNIRSYHVTIEESE